MLPPACEGLAKNGRHRRLFEALIEDEKECLGQLTKIVPGAAQGRHWADEQFVRLRTGDGMAYCRRWQETARFRRRPFRP